MWVKERRWTACLPQCAYLSVGHENCSAILERANFRALLTPRPCLAACFVRIEKPGVGMRERIGLSALLIIRSVSKIVLLTSMLAFASDIGNDKLTTITAPGVHLDVFANRDEKVVARDNLIELVHATSQSGLTDFGG